MNALRGASRESENWRRRTNANRGAIAVLASVGLTAWAAELKVTSSELDRARLYLQQTRDEVIGAPKGLAPTRTATTVRLQDGKAGVIDGRFAETKEQLAGYYIIDCMDLDEAIDWAARIPTECQGSQGCVEIRPLRRQSLPEPATILAHDSRTA